MVRTGLQLFDDAFETLDLLTNLDELGPRGDDADLVPFGNRGAPQIMGIGRKVAHDARLSAHHHAVADLDVIPHSDLSGQHDVVPGRATAGDPDVGTEQVVPSNAAIVGDHDLIVDLGSVADRRRSIRAAIDRGAGTDFHVGANFDVPKLR